MKEKHRVSYGFASTVWGFALAQSEPNFEKTSVAKDKYPSVFYMVDGRLETILDVANKTSKEYHNFISSEDPAYIYR